MAAAGVVGAGGSAGGKDYLSADEDGGAGNSPTRNFGVGFDGRFARPHDRAVAGVERVQKSGRPKRVDATVAEERRRARTGAGVRLVEPNRVLVSPHRRAGGQVIA